MRLKYVSSFVAGGLMGVVAGMLIVPRINEDTKRRIFNQGVEIVNDASDKITEIAQE